MQITHFVIHDSYNDTILLVMFNVLLTVELFSYVYDLILNSVIKIKVKMILTK